MADTAISGLTAAGNLELDELIEIVQSATNKKLDLASLLHPAFIYQNADRTLTSSTAQQKLFDQVANGTLTLPSTGLYEWDALIYLTGMSATSGNGAMSIIGGGSAVLGGQLMHAVGIDNTAPGTAGAQGGAAVQGASAFTTNMITAGTGTAMGVRVSGLFKCTTVGTIIPSIALQTAAAATLKAGSFFRIRKVAENGVFSRGAWS